MIVYSLGICAELERLMDDIVANYKCEWKEVVYDEELQKKFQQFVNTRVYFARYEG